MAVATTAMTTPLLLWLRKGTEIEEPIARSGFLGEEVREKNEVGESRLAASPPATGER